MSTRILHVIARMNLGGTARYVAELVERIPNSVLVTGYVQGAEIEDPCMTRLEAVRIKSLGRKISPFRDLQAWIDLKRVIKEMNPEIVHTHTFKAGLIGRLVPGHHKVVHTFHGHLFEDNSFSGLAKILVTIAEKFLANHTDLLISVGAKVGMELRAEGVGRFGNWVSIPPGVAPLLRIDKKQARKKMGVDEESFLLGWMARVTSVKNPILLLEIAKQLPSIQFIMAGGGDLLQKIKDRAPGNVKVIGWADASIFWSAVDCAISTSDNEGMPIALIEAQLSGVPVIATDVGSNSEVIENNSTGILSRKNVVDLVNSVLILSRNSELRNTMSENAARRAREKFSISTMIETHIENYNKL